MIELLFLWRSRNTYFCACGLYLIIVAGQHFRGLTKHIVFVHAYPFLVRGPLHFIILHVFNPYILCFVEIKEGKVKESQFRPAANTSTKVIVCHKIISLKCFGRKYHTSIVTMIYGQKKNEFRDLWCLIGTGTWSFLCETENLKMFLFLPFSGDSLTQERLFSLFLVVAIFSSNETFANPIFSLFFFFLWLCSTVKSLLDTPTSFED